MQQSAERCMIYLRNSAFVSIVLAGLAGSILIVRAEITPYAADNESFQGRIDEVRISNIARSAAQFVLSATAGDSDND